MKGYKGFHKGLICRDKQYTENAVFEEPEANICKRGMHFCKNPFDVLGYYDFVCGNGELNEFAEVEALDEVKTNDDRKFCTKKLRIGTKLSLAEFIQVCAETAKDLNNSKDCAEISSSEDSIQVGVMGCKSKVAITGFDSKVASTGNHSEVTFMGRYSTVASTGNYFKTASTGESCIICCTGINSRAKAKKGSWITLAEWEWSKEKKDYIPVCVKTEYVDDERILADVFYTIKDGEFQEVV
ncbi:DUF7666 domain-containing protein [Butyricicoccus intestinisimiae]|uniref:DUF7666 domain-containing protein n=1 Tax=Butyricicoccus intestinisimiae TaxID=2841509 RepID=A0ABS6EWZ9_9FIRM|nr:hypothetical protein [Butyricicoccus intestinisimiae]MBU5491349.1 hypothetical protein [Butyricicoccus intestinisimiae]